jgi:hypothetical protein
MHAHGVDIGAVQQALVRGRVVGLDALDQLVLAQKLGTPPASDGRWDGRKRKRLGRAGRRLQHIQGGVGTQ